MHVLDTEYPPVRIFFENANLGTFLEAHNTLLKDNGYPAYRIVERKDNRLSIITTAKGEPIHCVYNPGQDAYYATRGTNTTNLLFNTRVLHDYTTILWERKKALLHVPVLNEVTSVFRSLWPEIVSYGTYPRDMAEASKSNDYTSFIVPKHKFKEYDDKGYAHYFVFQEPEKRFMRLVNSIYFSKYPNFAPFIKKQLPVPALIDTLLTLAEVNNTFNTEINYCPFLQTQKFAIDIIDRDLLVVNRDDFEDFAEDVLGLVIVHDIDSPPTETITWDALSTKQRKKFKELYEEDYELAYKRRHPRIKAKFTPRNIRARVNQHRAFMHAVFPS